MHRDPIRRRLTLPRQDFPAALAPFFSAKNVAEMAWYGATATAVEVAAGLHSEGQLPARFTYRHLFNGAYEALTRKHRVEYFFKNTVLRKLVFGKYSPNTTAFYTEFPVGDARADAVLVNGHATAFEIKTGYDDFARAPHQIDQYYRCFRFLIFVVEVDQVERACALLPDEVGILALTKRNALKTVRHATERTDLIDTTAIFKALQKREYTAILGAEGYDISGIHPARRYSYSCELFSRLPGERALGELEHALRLRHPAHHAAALCDSLPESLHAAAFSYRMRRQDWKSLTDRLDTEFPKKFQRVSLRR